MSLHARDILAASGGQEILTSTSECIKENVEIGTPHWPVEFMLDFSRITRYENLQMTNSRNHKNMKTRKTAARKTRGSTKTVFPISKTM